MASAVVGRYTLQGLFESGCFTHESNCSTIGRRSLVGTHLGYDQDDTHTRGDDRKPDFDIIVIVSHACCKLNIALLHSLHILSLSLSVSLSLSLSVCVSVCTEAHDI